MNIMSKEELRQKIERGDDFKLINSLDRTAFDRMHIPGSLHFDDINEAVRQIDPDEEVILYCSNPLCPASVQAYRALELQGFTRLFRYAGGLTEWVEAGYPLVGSEVPIQ